MAFRDTLIEIRNELAEVRSQRQSRAAADQAELDQERQEVSKLANSLGIVGLLTEMNNTLLAGQGEVDTIVSWEAEDDIEEGDSSAPQIINLDAEDAENDDVITSVLTWEEDGEREIAVEVILGEEGISLQINGVEIRPERDALELGLVESFRDELEL